MFEFDPDKSRANKAKHGIDFVAAQALWNDTRAIRFLVYRDGIGEARWLVTGRIEDKLWTAVVTYRGAVTRIISVRRARDNEVKSYG